jgi:hypothetical protein
MHFIRLSRYCECNIVIRTSDKWLHLLDFDIFVTDSIGDCNIPGNATLLYDIKFVGLYTDEQHMDWVSFLIFSKYVILRVDSWNTTSTLIVLFGLLSICSEPKLVGFLSTLLEL